MLLEEFSGGMYQALSPTFAADACINLYAETRRAEGSTKTRVLYGTPGLLNVGEGTGAGNRGWFSQDSRTFTVIGMTLYEATIDTATPSVTLTSRGSIADDGVPCSFASNGQGGDQLAIVGGGQLKIFDLSTNTLSAAIVLPFSNPVQVVFLDGYFLINQANTLVVWFSALEDGTSWDALDFFARVGASDTVVAIGVARNRIWVFGNRSTTLFYDSGDADTPFVPYPETTTQIGIVNPWTLARRNDTFTWLAYDSTGTARVVKAAGDPSPQPVSTPPIERVIAQCPDLSTAVCLTYMQDGHDFYALTCPDSPDDVKTYVWDDTERLWHARAGWDDVAGAFTRWRAAGCCQSDNLVLVGDFEDGRVYALSLTTYDDDGDILRRLRRIPYISTESATFVFIDEVELVGEVGVGLTIGQGVDPLADLRISRDGAKTWTSAGSRGLGAGGRYDARTFWTRLGRVRPDRLGLEVTLTDPVKAAWLGLRMRVSAGTGQL